MHITHVNPRAHESGWRWLHPSCLEETELLKHCNISTGRATGGPGGQHRNKVETQVFIRHIPSDIEARADERRSQIENKRVALFRLRLALATDIRVPVPIGEIGSGLWKSRCRNRRIACNPSHEDFPALLAEALDVIASCKWDAQKAALRLECTPSQLIKLIKAHPPALLIWNEQRRARGEHDLK